MKNKFLKKLILITLFFSFSNFSIADDEINFKITEIDILENGNLIVGDKGGKAITDDGLK